MSNPDLAALGQIGQVAARVTEYPQLKVAIVEDAENIRERLVQLVSDVGGILVIGEADTEEKAIELCRAKNPDAVILDMQLAIGSGLGVLRAMAYSSRDPNSSSGIHPAIIVLTNFPSPAVERAARALGAEWFLDKSREFHKLPLLLRGLIARNVAHATTAPT